MHLKIATLPHLPKHVDDSSSAILIIGNSCYIYLLHSGFPYLFPDGKPIQILYI